VEVLEMDYPVLNARVRTLRGKGVARKLRALGYLPAVLYGRGQAARPLVVDPKKVVAILNGPTGQNTVVRVDVEGEGQDESALAVIRDYSVHPVRRMIEHCDFMRVDDRTELTVKVPLRFTGKSEGEKLGARVNIALRWVTMKCAAHAVPEAIMIDLSPFKVGQTLSLSQLSYPEGTQPLFARDAVVLSIRMPRGEKGAEGAEAAAAPAEGEAAAKPETAVAAPAKPEGKPAPAKK
jgi:large subunit ribosomal protein L25